METNINEVKLDIVRLARVRQYLSGDVRKLFEQMIAERVRFVVQQEAQQQAAHG